MRAPREPEEPEEEGEPGDPSFDPDEIRFDDKGKKGKEGKVDQKGMSDKEIGEIWLRGLQTSPKGFLRTKFAIQAQAEKQVEKQAMKKAPLRISSLIACFQSCPGAISVRSSQV